jgi:hypothetical protein
VTSGVILVLIGLKKADEANVWVAPEGVSPRANEVFNLIAAIVLIIICAILGPLVMFDFWRPKSGK